MLGNALVDQDSCCSRAVFLVRTQPVQNTLARFAARTVIGTKLGSPKLQLVSFFVGRESYRLFPLNDGTVILLLGLRNHGRDDVIAATLAVGLRHSSRSEERRVGKGWRP